MKSENLYTALHGSGELLWLKSHVRRGKGRSKGWKVVPNSLWSKCTLRALLFVIIFIMVITELNAQQSPLFNSALINPVLENPSIVGYNKYSQSFLHYRKQWLDIEGAPESALLSVDWPLKNEKSGLGLIVSSDRTNILGHIGFMAAYSHNLKINEDQNIRFGLALNLNHNTIYFERINAENEQESTLFNHFESATGVNAYFGASYNYKGLRAGLSVKNLVNSKLQYSNSTENKNLYYQYVPQYLINVNYTWPVSEEMKIRPEVALRDIHGMPVQFESSVLATYQDKYSTGVVYRNKNSLAFLVSMLVYERLTVSYGYQAALGDISAYNGGTHEVTLGYRFFTSHYQEYKPAGNEKIDELLEFAQNQVDNNNELKEDNKKLKEEQKRLNRELIEEKEEIERLKEVLKAERGRFNQAKAEDEIELDELPANLINNPNVPIYIILGVFADNYQAKKFQQILRREHGMTTVILKRKDKQDYIVCVNRKYESKEKLSKELKKYKKISSYYSNSEAWIYVIQ